MLRVTGRNFKVIVIFLILIILKLVSFYLSNIHLQSLESRKIKAGGRSESQLVMFLVPEGDLV